MFYNDHISTRSTRGSGALEISQHARKVAKDQVTLLAGLQAESHGRKPKATRWSLTQILTSLKIF